MQILLQDKYNIGVLKVNIEFMWLCTKDSLKACLSPVSKPCHINSIFSQYTNIVYILNLLSSIPDCFSAWLSMSLENHSVNSSCESNIVGMIKCNKAQSYIKKTKNKNRTLFKKKIIFLFFFFLNWDLLLI